MTIAEELEVLLPAELPNRPTVRDKAAAHLELIIEANRQFNLTRITGAREAAIKHVVDSVAPWRLFSDVQHVLDAGTGAGFPGIPLALVLPQVRFTLSESIGKKARFVESAVKALGLSNVDVMPRRAEEILKSTLADIITARAVAPVGRAGVLFAPALRNGARAILYKGPDAETELTEAAPGLRRQRLQAQVVFRYELPDALGTRNIVEIRRTT